MEVLAVLEKKIVTLVELVKELQVKNEALKKELADAQESLILFAEERDQMTIKIQAFEAQELSQREQTKCMVDSLINDIDGLLSKEHQL
jgi:hypothetical protein